MSNDTKAAGFADETNPDDFSIDMSTVDENAGGFEVLPRATYQVIVDSLEFGNSKSGNPMWSWTLQVSEGEYTGRKLFYHSVFMEKTMGRVKKDLARVAPELLQGSFRPKAIADEGTLLGKEMACRVDQRMYEGSMRNNVKELLAPSSGGAAGGSFFPS